MMRLTPKKKKNPPPFFMHFFILSSFEMNNRFFFKQFFCFSCNYCINSGSMLLVIVYRGCKHSNCDEAKKKQRNAKQKLIR